MNFLIDNSLSPRIAEWLRDVGHDAVHVLKLGLGDADDTSMFDRAATDDRVIVSMDPDFGTILAMRKTTSPSVVLFRRDAPGHPRKQADLLLSSIPGFNMNSNKVQLSFSTPAEFVCASCSFSNEPASAASESKQRTLTCH